MNIEKKVHKDEICDVSASTRVETRVKIVLRPLAANTIDILTHLKVVVLWHATGTTR
jgi:hypothetical protein